MHNGLLEDFASAWTAEHTSSGRLALGPPGRLFQRYARELKFGERLKCVPPGIQSLTIDDNQLEQADFTGLMGARG